KNKISEREKDDIFDFIKLRDKVRFDDGEINISINQLNNSLEILRKAIDSSPENRLLNNWTSLEYILNTYEGQSIIGKVIDIVPKIICMYHIKDRLNMLWENLEKYRSNKNCVEIEIIENLFRTCSKETRKYDKNHFLKFLSCENNLEQLKRFEEENVVLYREIAYIREILSLKKLKESIVTLREVIEHDITRIYRLRNKLVHSDSSNSVNVDITTIRLNKYIYSLIGTLIHYLKRQPNLHISEVLNSIHETYDWYICFLDSHKNQRHSNTDDLVTAAFPPYLYL
ncbi:MAG: hypothetical protein ACRCWQ_11130, partial [Bacilli bacterium]